MGQTDSTAVDTVIYGVANVVQNNGWNIALSGILVVFGGLVLIAVTIFFFNKIPDKYLINTPFCYNHRYRAACAALPALPIFSNK